MNKNQATSDKHICCPTHCCILHGCKYGMDDCPVALGVVKQKYLCYNCSDYRIESFEELDAEVKLNKMPKHLKVLALDLALQEIHTNCNLVPFELELMKLWIEKQKRLRGYKPTEDAILCDGDVYPKVTLDDDSGCGCCSSSYIRVEFRCNKCNVNHEEFPYDETWFNQFIKDIMNGKKAEEIRAELIQKGIDHQIKLNESIAKMELTRKGKK